MTIDLTNSAGEEQPSLLSDTSKNSSNQGSEQSSVKKAKLLVLKDKKRKQIWVQRVPQQDGLMMQKLIDSPSSEPLRHTHSRAKVRIQVKNNKKKTDEQAKCDDEMVDTPNNNQHEGNNGALPIIEEMLDDCSPLNQKSA